MGDEGESRKFYSYREFLDQRPLERMNTALDGTAVVDFDNGLTVSMSVPNKSNGSTILVSLALKTPRFKPASRIQSHGFMPDELAQIRPEIPEIGEDQAPVPVFAIAKKDIEGLLDRVAKLKITLGQHPTTAGAATSSPDKSEKRGL